MKILFLDIDGVMISAFSIVEDNRNFPLEKINFLNKIIEESNCYIVISSCLRILKTLVELKETFKANNFKYPERIIDVTPNLRKSKCRGEEIQTWINENKDKYDISKIAILDDGYLEKLNVHLIKTSWDKGLTRDETNKVIERLK